MSMSISVHCICVTNIRLRLDLKGFSGDTVKNILKYCEIIENFSIFAE